MVFWLWASFGDDFGLGPDSSQLLLMVVVGVQELDCLGVIEIVVGLLLWLFLGD